MTIELDTCGLLCPLPVLKARKRLMQMESGDVLRVTADDPNEAARLQALQQLGLLDSPPEERFDRYTRIARCGAGARARRSSGPGPRTSRRGF